MNNPETWDLFICHATEDKEDIARPLAHLLHAANLKVWFDEFSLKLGDSLTESISRGLKGSKYGLVIFSPDFFGKQWTERELRTLLNLEKRILPIWHNVDKQDIEEHYPFLTDLYAVKSKEGFERIVDSILRNFHPLVEQKA
jgi:hypothetical protein